MLNANALWINYGLTPKYAVLVVWLLICLIVLAYIRAQLWQKLVYYIINVSIIFSVSAGYNVVGIPKNQIIHTTGQQVAVTSTVPNISGLFFESAKVDN